MKILVFTTLFPNNIWPNHGGFIKERMAAVARLNGCEIRVVAPIPYYPPVRIGWRWRYSQVAWEEVIDGLPVSHPRYFLIPKVGMPVHGLMMFLSVLPFVKKLRSKFDFDVIDAHYVYPDGFAAILLGRLLCRPVVVSARGSDINAFARFPMIRPLITFTLRRAEHIIAVSRALGQAVMNLGISDGKVSLIPNGVDPAKFKRVSKASAREALHLSSSQKIALSVGGLNPVKGFDLLIRAFKVLLDQQGRPECSLVIVGDGPLRKRLEQLISGLHLSSHARLVGMVPHSELYRWYSAADVFCLTSEHEGRPNVILEALSCGIPTVATAVGGVPEIINSASVGLLAERNEQSIADKLGQAIVKDWDSGKIMSLAKNYNWQAAAEKLADVFDCTLNTGWSAGNATRTRSTEASG